MVDLDIEYIQHKSLWNDIKIMFKTVVVMLHPNGAYLDIYVSNTLKGLKE